MKFSEILQDRRKKRKRANVKIELVESFNGYNVIKVDNNFVAVLQELGNVHLMVERLGERELPPYLLTGDNLESIKLKLLTKNIEHYSILDTKPPIGLG